MHTFGWVGVMIHTHRWMGIIKSGFSSTIPNYPVTSCTVCSGRRCWYWAKGVGTQKSDKYLSSVHSIALPQTVRLRKTMFCVNTSWSPTRPSYAFAKGRRFCFVFTSLEAFMETNQSLLKAMPTLAQISAPILLYVLCNHRHVNAQEISLVLL